jgi:hypothetical protein
VVPPLVGVAVNVIDELAHIGVPPAVMAMLTDGVTCGFTVTEMALDVTAAGNAQTALEVIVHTTD